MGTTRSRAYVADHSPNEATHFALLLRPWPRDRGRVGELYQRVAPREGSPMSIRFAPTALLVFTLGLETVATAQERKDIYGDPLPPGAYARLGTDRGAHVFGWGTNSLL